MNNKLLNAKATLPAYDRNTLVPRIVHLGFGAFHRAHQAVYTDILAAEHNSDWGYTEVNLIGGEQQIADLKAQDNLYTVAEMSADAWTARVVGVVKNALHAQVDSLETVLAAMCEPQVAIVSLTITEKGYCHAPATGQLMLDHPLIAADLQNPQQPKSAPGVVVEALARRKAAGLPAFSVMSCDNMPENGHVMRNVTCAYARAVNAELADWIEANVTFPSTMVDRIVPAVTAETLDKIEQITGVRDPAGVACEPFRQWVIEDNFVAGRPEWEKAGAELVADVIPFEEMKLRMLNGSHSFLAYLGYLAGYQHINDCMEDENYRRAAHALMLNEQAPTLKVKGVDLARYADLLIARYSNPALRHRTWQIAMDGSQKLPQRMLDSVRWHLVHQQSFPLLALGVAGWMRYVGGVDESGNTIEVCDPLLTTIQAAVKGSAEGESRVKALLGIEAIFGNELPLEARFVDAVMHAYKMLLGQGAKATVAQTVSQK
ncbi:mannitol dehydrogenase family protein [Lelliottia nimipressuralis]|uniref:mannitol dehydrogenase family protein n=1 Tax=Lelliottia nimipressuralis TaxID=69220 RepID=UPI003906B1C6